MAVQQDFWSALTELDEAIAQFKEHPMYAEWLDTDEVNVTKCICNEDDCKECNWEKTEEDYADLLENLYE